ncbi:DUF1826 domain-containing protein [Parasphingorhabdus sp.]|uniref:DUF1826 domain-containing protein n=1 Tax=Parasphingorhabdus sp. TaxID=2709688 RepID=UPI003299BBB7
MILGDIPELDDCTTIATAPDGLCAILQPETAAAVWQRAPLARFQNWIDALPPERLPKARMILRSDAVCDALINVAEQYGTPCCAERNLLIEDASALASIFAKIMDSDYLRLRLDVVRANAHHNFNINSVKARLICTYRGTGTQYGISEDGYDPERIVTVATGSPIILRGARWPEIPLSDLLHRSPPMTETAKARLVLVLDPVDNPEEEAKAAHIQ